MRVHAEIVNGKCPTCDEFTMLVGLTPEMFRCMNCGADLEDLSERNQLDKKASESTIEVTAEEIK